MLDSIRKKTFVADGPHAGQRAVHADWQEVFAQTRQCRRVGPAEHVRRDCEIELIDQTLFQQ